MPAPLLHGMYSGTLLRALQDALYQWEFDLCWEDLKRSFGQPKAKDADDLLRRMMSEYLARQAGEEVNVTPPKRRRGGARRS